MKNLRARALYLESETFGASSLPISEQLDKIELSQENIATARLEDET